jgi:hypothetical protein
MFLAFTIINVSPFSAHHVCKLSEMVSLRSHFAVGRKQIEEATLEKLKRGENTRNVARLTGIPKLGCTISKATFE